MVNNIRPLTPKQRRALLALLNGPITRREAGEVSGALNAPQTVSELRAKGLPVATEWKTGIDRDGRPYRMGLYSLPESAHEHARQLLALQKQVRP
ncbi:MAG: helix-turn-helix domain-containing protein [Saccharospirillaceae bacterium]|nr:helix-turn-helix domain-containing protein [Saccharospirillaceae bacterium]MCD8530307.1 helix-turn-helix domain-containing protein [Saccharospirillaceae bacterium]